MKNLVLGILFLFAFAACNSCVPQPSPTPTPAPTPTVVVVAAAPPEPTDAANAVDAGELDAAPAPLTTAAKVCAHLFDLKCDDATSKSACTQVLQHVIEQKLTTVPSACLLLAGTKAAARKCGLVSCQ